MFFSGSRGEGIFILFNPQTIWSKKYVKLNKSTSGRNWWNECWQDVLGSCSQHLAVGSRTKVGISRALLHLFWRRLRGGGTSICSWIQDFSKITASRLGSPYFRLKKKFKKEKTTWNKISWLCINELLILLSRTNKLGTSFSDHCISMYGL